MFVRFAFSEAWGDKIQRCAESLLSLRALTGVKGVIVHFADNVMEISDQSWRVPLTHKQGICHQERLTRNHHLKGMFFLFAHYILSLQLYMLQLVQNISAI